jgi:hypothetical protein
LAGLLIFGLIREFNVDILGRSGKVEAGGLIQFLRIEIIHDHVQKNQFPELVGF